MATLAPGPAGGDLQGSGDPAPAAVGRSAQDDDISLDVSTTMMRSKIITVQSWRKRAVEHFMIKDPELLRGMPWSRLLSGNAKVLANNQGDANSFDKSTPVTSINTFVSHTWNTPRWQKFLVLIFHFNLYPAFVVSLIVSTAICILTSYGFLPSATVGDLLLRDHDTGVAGTFTRGTLAMPVGVTVFLVCLLTLHELNRLLTPLSKHNVFLDKTCVHQTNLELKKAGIESLAGFLHRSDSVLVLYSDQYMQRLWTIYEVASWVILNRGEKLMIARPLFVPIMILVGYIFFVVTDVLYFVMSLTSREPYSSFGALGLITAVMLPEFTMMAFLAGKFAGDRERLESHVRNFRLADAKCFCEDDRNVVRDNIISFMRYTELAPAESSNQKVCEAFEELVRKEVPRLMWSSFGRVAMPYTWALVFAWPQMLTQFDLIAGTVIDSFEARRIATLTATNIAWAAGVLPLNMAFVFRITRCRWLRNIPGYIILGLVSCAIQAIARIILKTMATMSEESNAVLGALIGLYAALAAVNFAIFRR